MKASITEASDEERFQLDECRYLAWTDRIVGARKSGRHQLSPGRECMYRAGDC